MCAYHSNQAGSGPGNPLWSPASSAETVSLTALLDHGNTSVNAQDHCGNTSLIVAASIGHEQAVRSQLKRGASVNARNSLGSTALMEACRQGSLALTKLLLQNKADVSAQNAVGATPLAIASDSGHAEIVRTLIDAGAVVDAIGDGSGGGGGGRRHANCASPLIMACYRGHSSVVEILLRRGGDVDCKLGATGWTALMTAASCGHTAVCQLLLQRGGDAEMTNACDCNALDLAAAGGHGKTERLLERHTRRQREKAGKPRDEAGSIFEAAKEGNPQAVYAIVSNNQQQACACDVDGATPLMFAAIRGHTQVVEVLTKAGADINAQDSISGWTALMQATYYGHTALAEYLVEQGADVNLQAKDGFTAFEMARILGDTFLMRLLAKHSLKVAKKAGADQAGQGGNKKRPVLQKQWSRTSQQSSQSISGADGSGKDPLPGFIEADDNGSPSNFKKWFSNISTKIKRVTSSRVSDESMLQSFTSRPLSPTPSTAAQAQHRRKPPVQHRHLSLPWGNQGNMAPQRIHVEPATPASTGAPGPSRNVEFPPSFSAENGGRSDDNLLVTESAELHKQLAHVQAGRLPVDLHIPIIPPFHPSAAFDGHRNGSAADSDDSPTGDAPAMPPAMAVADKKSAVYRGVSSTSLNSSGGSVPRQTSMVRPSRRNSSSAITAVTAASPSSGGPMAANTSSQHTACPKPAGHRQLTVQLVQERNRQAEAAAVAAARSPRSDFFTPAKPSSSLDFLPQPAHHKPNIVSRHPHPGSPGAGSPGSALSPGWTSHGQHFFGHFPTSGIVHKRQGSSSAASQGSSEGTGSTISVERQRFSADDEFGNLLHKLKLGKHRAIFQEQEVDVETFLTLTDGDLRELGIQSGHERRQILCGIAQLSK